MVVVLVEGNDEFYAMMFALHSDQYDKTFSLCYSKRDATIGKYRDAIFRDIEICEKRGFVEFRFWGCRFENIEIVDSDIGEISLGGGSVVDNVYMSSSVFASLNVLGAMVVNSRIEGMNLGSGFRDGALSKVDNCEFLDIRMFGHGESIFEDIQNSKISGTVKKVAFRENSERTQCRNLDLSEALVPYCSFPGVDMGRIACNPAWEYLLVEDWYWYKPDLLEACDRLMKSENKDDVEAGRIIRKEIEYDEKAYGGDLDEDRGTAYIHSVTSPRLRDSTWERILDVYADQGIELWED